MKPEKKEFFDKWFFKTVGKPLYDYQINLLTKKGKVNVVNKSRQTGISTLMAAYGLYNAMLGKSVLIVSPSDRQSKHVMDIVNKFLLNVKHDPIKEHMKTSLQFSTGGEIRSLPNSASTVRGFTADVVILDEFAHFLNDTDNEIVESIAPSLSRGGELWMVSTPYAERGLFWKATSNSNYTQFRIHWTECKDLDEKTIKDLCPDPTTFAQEYENQFIGDIDTEFPYDLLHSAVNPDLVYEEPLESGNVLMGVDVGRKIDQTAILGVLQEKEKYKVVFKKVIKNTEFDAQQHYLEHLLNSRKLLTLTIDKTGIGAMLAENLKKKSHAVKPVDFTAQLKENLVINLKRLLINGLIEMPDDSQLINALHGIKRYYAATGHLKFDSERTELTGHSDTAWALMLAVFEAQKPKPVFGVIGARRKV